MDKILRGLNTPERKEMCWIWLKKLGERKNRGGKAG